MRDQETNRLKAQELENTAQRRLKSGCSGEVADYKVEEAATDLEKAANFYKLAKLHDLSAKASVQAAELYEGINQNYSAASHFAKAAKSFKLADNAKLAEHYSKLSIELWSQDGKFSMAAKAMSTLGEDFEKDGDFEGAASLFQTSAEYYENADAPSTAAGCLAKAADCLGQSKKFSEASDLFLTLAAGCLKRDLGKYKFDEYQMKAVLCKLASGDAVAAKKLCSGFSSQTTQSPKIQLTLTDLISAVEDKDDEEFAKLSGDFIFNNSWYN
jgi:alpha-soluble NSF attachment protein